MVSRNLGKAIAWYDFEFVPGDCVEGNHLGMEQSVKSLTDSARGSTRCFRSSGTTPSLEWTLIIKDRPSRNKSWMDIPVNFFSYSSGICFPFPIDGSNVEKKYAFKYYDHLLPFNEVHASMSEGAIQCHWLWAWFLISQCVEMSFLDLSLVRFSVEDGSKYLRPP